VNTKIPIAQLLRWRLSQAEADAPPAPRAGQLLELARPWWEVWPQQFQSVLERLSNIQIACGHAMAEPLQTSVGHPVPALIVRSVDEFETSASLLYLNIRDARLHLRFQLASVLGEPQPTFDVTFVSDPGPRVLFSAPAVCSMESEYRVDVELSEELAGAWKQLKVTDRMPFRLILRADTNG